MAFDAKSLALQLRALGHPIRLAIVCYLCDAAEKGASVGEIQARLSIPASTLSHHLDRLTHAGLTQSRRAGAFVYYTANQAQLRTLSNYLWIDCCKSGAREQDL
jgi:DNA-binding transcriptional ArsR family regulator